MDRRQFLLGTTGVLASCAGCSALSSQSVKLGLVVFNHSESPYTVEFELFRTDGDSSQPGGSANQDARVYNERIEVEPQEDVGEPSMTRRDAITESRPYVVRYRVWRDFDTPTDKGHVHFFPPGDDGDSDYVVFDIYSEGTLERR